MREITILSFAKINLSIDIQGLLPSGMHKVDMVMQQISFHDDVTVRYSDVDAVGDDSINISVETSRSYLPTDSRNLAYQAAALMARRYGKSRTGCIHIKILKRIPVAAGMAGGSGNGAAVLHALNVLWNLNLSLDALCKLGAELGSDVPFCVLGQARCNYNLPAKIRKNKMAVTCARATESGTRLEPVINGLRKNILIAKPPISVSTREVFQGIDKCRFSARPNNGILVDSLMNRGKSGLYDNFINVLETYTLSRYPAVLELKTAIQGLTNVEKVLMSGSGPTIFACFSSLDDAMTACREIRALGYEAYWTKCCK